MRYPLTIEPEAGKTHFLPWETDSVVVYNATQHTLFIRMGTDSVPSGVSDCDLFVPPYSNQTFPARSKLWGFYLTEPSLPDEIPGLAGGKCLVVFQAGERDSAFAAMPIATSYNQTDDELVIQQDARAAGAYSDGPYTVPAYTRTLIVRAVGVNTTQLVVTAGPTARTTYVATPSTVEEQNAINGGEFFIPWYRSTDSEITIDYTASAATLNGYQIRASRNAYPGGWREIRGQQRVNVMPIGLSALPVTVDGPDPLPVAFDSAGNRGNYLPLAVRAASTAGAQLPANGATGLRLYVQCTAAAGTWQARLQTTPGGVVPFLITDLTPAAGAGVGLFAIEYHPAITAAGALAGTNTLAKVSTTLPAGWQIAIVHAAAGNYTYAVDYELIP